MTGLPLPLLVPNAERWQIVLGRASHGASVDKFQDMVGKVLIDRIPVSLRYFNHGPPSSPDT